MADEVGAGFSDGPRGGNSDSCDSGGDREDRDGDVVSDRGDCDVVSDRDNGDDGVISDSGSTLPTLHPPPPNPMQNPNPAPNNLIGVGDGRGVVFPFLSEPVANTNGDVGGVIAAQSMVTTPSALLLVQKCLMDP